MPSRRPCSIARRNRNRGRSSLYIPTRQRQFLPRFLLFLLSLPFPMPRNHAATAPPRSQSLPLTIANRNQPVRSAPPHQSAPEFSFSWCGASGNLVRAPYQRLEPEWQCRGLRRGRAFRPSAAPGGAPISASSHAPPPYPPTSSAALPRTPAGGLVFISGDSVLFCVRAKSEMISHSTNI